MGDSKTYNYPKSNRASTSSQAGHSSSVTARKRVPHEAQNLEREQTDEGQVKRGG